MITVHDARFRYTSIFDPATGTGVRGNIYDEAGADTGEDPFMASFPELLDVGIMGSCAHGKSGLCLQSGVECYQNGIGISEEDMPFSNFKKIIDECKGRTFQVALGGRGDPDMHKEIVPILRYARENDVVPNFTTSGFGLKKELLPVVKECCGAVAVSWYRNEYTRRAIEMFLEAGIRTNIHYCLSASTIDEAVDLMENKRFPAEINRVIFLLHKPVGLGTFANVLQVNDPRVKRFFSLFDAPHLMDKSGFDSCSVPALLHFTSKIDPMCIEACEAGRFSAYITPDFKLVPCSFEKDAAFAVPIENSGIETAWNGEVFERFRSRLHGNCPGCTMQGSCLGGCPVVSEITLCNSSQRAIARRH